MARTMAKVKSVAAGSPAARAGLMAGDVVLAVDGYEMIDIIDWRFLTSDYSFTIFVERGGVELELQVFRDEMAELGVEFEDILFDGIKECANRCVFCFVDQLPDGVRSSLCIKDDDYRLSFLQGNFVTLTNCSKRTLDRIVEFRMSPIYVSVHATDPVTRNLMLGRKST
ncbi:MAG TPA: PDZ domain-containing protein, partial [Bacillota bacterium]|nr:PDZ domain-containing protein [Bacillota bacterium]